MRLLTLSQWRDLRIGVICEDLGALTTARAREFWICVCVSITLSVNSPTGQTLRRIFTVGSLKDADLRKNVSFGV